MSDIDAKKIMEYVRQEVRTARIAALEQAVGVCEVVAASPRSDSMGDTDACIAGIRALIDAIRVYGEEKRT